MQAGLRQGRLYAGYGAGALFPVEEHVALLSTIEKFYQSIVAGAENRIEERTHFEDREVDVVVGIDRVMRKVREAPAGPAAPVAVATGAFTETVELSPTGMTLVAAAPAQAAPAAVADADVERWHVFDLSSKGFGLLVDRPTAELVPPNGILALRNQESGTWIIGTVVRKLPNRARGETLIGIEVLSYRPIAVDCIPGDNGAPMQALYVPGTDPNGKLDAIVVQVGDFRNDQSLAIAAAGATYRIRLNRIIRKGSDWIKARFEIESKA